MAEEPLAKTGAKAPGLLSSLYAALKRRSSRLLHASAKRRNWRGRLDPLLFLRSDGCQAFAVELEQLRGVFVRLGG
jgi:hypothetical protein